MGQLYSGVWDSQYHFGGKTAECLVVFVEKPLHWVGWIDDYAPPETESSLVSRRAARERMRMMSVSRDYCLIMALREEAGELFEAAGIPVLYCGVGKVNATHVLTRELWVRKQANAPLPLVVNFGTAGSRRVASGTLLACHEFVQRDMDVRGLGFPLGTTPFEELPPRLRFDPVFKGLPVGVCGSGDSFAMSDAEVACDVLDMEAYALAKVCLLEGAGFACAKYVTDGADDDSAAHWRERTLGAGAEFWKLYTDLAFRSGSVRQPSIAGPA